VCRKIYARHRFVRRRNGAESYHTVTRYKRVTLVPFLLEVEVEVLGVDGRSVTDFTGKKLSPFGRITHGLPVLWIHNKLTWTLHDYDKLLLFLFPNQQSYLRTPCHHACNK